MVRTVSGLVAAALIALSAFLAPAAGADPAGPGLFSSTYQSADAVWLRKESGDTFMYFAGAAHSINLTNQKMRSVAWASRTKCAVAKTKRIKVVACAGSARAKRIAPEDFQFDPLMETARLDHKDARLTWQAQDPPEPWGSPFADPSFGAGAFASVDRWAPASGKVLGTRMEGGRWSDMGFLSQGAFAFLSITTPGGHYRLDPDTNMVHYRFRYEIAD